MKKYYAVIDTNVIVSAVLKSDSIPGVILEMAFNGMIIPIYNDEILSEYMEVLRRPKFRIADEEANVIVNSIENCGIKMPRKHIEDSFPDLNDVVFYEVTMKAREQYETKLITGNTKHFPEKKFVLTPRQMLDLIIKDNE